MRKKRRGRSGYSSIQTAIWLVGIGILALTDWWWPGILFLVGISVLVSAFLPTPKNDQAKVPPATLTEDSSDPGVEEQHHTAVIGDHVSQYQAAFGNDTSWLPSRCIACGAPITSETVIWKDFYNQRAYCPYCDTHLKPIP